MSLASLNDAIAQFSALIGRLSSSSNNAAANMRGGPAFEAHLQRAMQLSFAETWTCLRQLQLWLSSFPAEGCAAAMIKMVELSVPFQGHQAPPTLQHVYQLLKENDPAKRRDSLSQRSVLGEDDDDALENANSFDASGWLDKAYAEVIEDKDADTVELFLFKTACLILRQMSTQSGLHLLAPQVVVFYFESIEKGSTLYVQRCAALACSIISKAHLPVLVSQFFDKQMTIVEKKFRWLLYQQATQMFAFGVATQEQAEVTVRYLESISKKMAKIDRGKLRGAICTSLEKVFGSIMGAHSPEAQAEWRNFTARFGMLSKQFSDAFVSIYTTVVKWAKKSKHALPCWRLMVRMTSVGSVQFYTDKKREPILPLLLKGAAKFRLECLSYICDLYSSLPAELARADMEGFTADCKKVLALCFPKKKDPEPEERPLFFGIITSIGKINPHLAFTELQSLLGSKDTSIIAKGVLCQSLGSVAREFPREVSGYNNYFGPLLLQFMTDQDQFLAGNAIRSFPFVTVPDPQKEKLILEYVTRVVVSTESKEMSDTAFKSLCSYLVLEPDVNLVPLAVIFLNILGNRTFSKGNHQDYSKLFPAFKYLRRLIHLYLSILEKDGKATGITASQWLPMRMQAEGLTLMWLTHTEYEVRKLALSLLAAFSEPVFDELENAKSKAPKESRLVYILQALPQDSPNEKWSPVLVGLFDAVRGTDVLRPPLEYAWIRLFVRFEGSISALHALDLEKLQLWLNMVRFLMCSLAYPEVKDESESQNAVMNNKVSPGAMNQAFVLLLRVAWQPPSNMQELRSILLSYMGMLHPSCIEQAVHVVKHIRMQSVMDKGEKKMKGKEKAKWEEEARRAENSWCFHHDVLELLSRFVIQLNDQFDPAKSAGKPSLPTFLAQTLHRCVYAWMKDFEQNGNQNIGHRLSPVIRCYGMRMMRVFLDPSSGFTERPQANLLLSIMQAWTPAPRALYLHAAYRQIPRHLERYADDKDPKESSSEERDRKLLEIAVVNAVERLLKLGPLAASGGEGLPKQALSFLQSMALRGPHLRQHVEAALEAFLKHQPNFKNIFFKHSVVDVIYDELCLTNEAAVLLAAIMLSALVRNWCADISLWYSVHQVSQPQMLMVSLLHQCSPDPTCRSLGGKLAAALETHPALALEADASSLIATTEFGGLSLCVAATYKYSRLLATKYATQIGGPLLQEVVAAAQLLPDVQNESMLQLMLPWIEHFGDDDTSEEQWVRFIDHLLQMSYQCHTRANSSFLFFTLELCWQAVLANKSVPQLASWTISFLVTQHANNAMLPQLDEHMSDEAKAKQEAKQIYQHLCLRIVLFIATASNVNNLCDLLRLEMPDHSSVPDEPNAHNVQELTSWFATEKLHTDIADERQISAFLLSSELFIAHAHTLQRDQLPRLLQLACVHFGPNAPAHMRHGSELLSRVLAALSALRKDEREPLHEPPTDAAGRAKLIEALCCCDGGDELRQQWAAQALKWAFLALDSREAIDSIEWYSSLVGGSLLQYQVLYRIVVFLCACLEQEREEEAAALLTMLRDHVLALDSLPYDVGALLAAPALLVLNSNVRLHFGLGQSMLRALLERSLNLGRRELLIGAALDAHESNGGAAFASTTWKASLLHPALTAQLDIIGASPSIDKALRMLLLRGASLAEFADDSAWLLADLRALYDGLLPECDQLSLSILWIMMLRACTYPRTPEGDHACDIADRFLQARGSYFDNLRPIFFALHSSAGSRQYAMSLDGSDPVGAGTAEEALRSKKADFWLEPLSDFLSNLKLLYSTIDDQQRSFEVLLDATCLWLLLCKDVEGGTDADTVHRWVILNMLEKLLSEFRGIWSEAQHAATANLLSSWVFRLNSDVHDVHASKIRMCMQHLVSDPPPDSMDEPLVFIQRGAGTETGVSLAAICAAAASKGHFANDFFFLPSIPAQEWLAHLTACTAQLAPVQYDDSMPKVHIDLERVPPPRQSPLPVTGGQMREFLTPQPIRGFMAPTSFLAAPSGALPPPPMLGSIAALPPPPLLGQSRPSSTSIELPPPPLNMSSMGTSGVLPPPFGGVGAMPPPLGGMSSIPPPLPSSMPPPPLASGNSSVSVLPPPPFLGGGAPETPLPMPNFPPGMPPPPGRDGRSESGVLMGGLGAPPQLPSRGPSISNARFSSPSLPPPLPSLLSAGAPESVSFPPPPPPLSSNLGSALPPPPNLFGSKLPPPPNLFGSAAPQQANLHSGVQATHPYSDPPVVDCRPREDSTKVSEYI